MGIEIEPPETGETNGVSAGVGVAVIGAAGMLCTA